MSDLQNENQPYKVFFVGESCIDEGGPGRELLTEASISIFEPSTKVILPCPNNRNKVGRFTDSFIPYNTSYSRIEDYYTIGILLGIIVRTGLVQSLPFSPFVWKFIAGNIITQDDLLAVDSELSDYFNCIRKELPENTKYTVLTWDGKRVYLPNHHQEELVTKSNLETYINKCIEYRRSSILPFLKKIRKGFLYNTELTKETQFSGSLMSYLAQGNGIITTIELRSLSFIQGYSGMNHPAIIRFFNVVDRFSPEQRKLLLKFITALTRIPVLKSGEQFKFTIKRMPCTFPDSRLPTAATCSYTLYWPEYSNDEIAYEKLLLAIQYCQTMENS
jgi:hypothetical protein